MYLGSARASGASDALPSRVGTTSEESSPGAESSKKDTKKKVNKVLKRPASSKTKGKPKTKQDDDEHDDDDESPDDDHQPIAKGLHKDDDDEDSADLEGLQDLLRLDGDESKPKKRPASKSKATSGSMKRPGKKVGTPKVYP